MCRLSSHTVFLLAATLFAAGPAIAQLPPHDPGNQISCDDCHPPGRGFYPDDQELEAMCRSCHNPTGAAAAMSNVASHIIHDGNSVIVCTSCHAPHGPHPTLDPHAGGITAPNLKLIRRNTGDYVSGAAEPALFQLDPEHFAFAEDNPPWTGICQSCHTQTKHHTNDGSADHEHQIGSDCTSCHRHENGFAPPADLCTGCHSQPQGARRQVVGAGGDFEHHSSHVSGSVKDEDCLVCHEISQHQQGAVRLRDLDNGGVWVGDRDLWCLICHDGDPPDGVVFPTEKGSGYDKSAYLNSTHERYLGPNSCSHCHRAHDSEHPSLLDDIYAVQDYSSADQTDGGYALCWRCHDRTGLLAERNAFDRHHDKHVNKANAPCFICHDVHAPSEADEPGLINLDHAVRLGYDVSYIEGYNAGTAFGFTQDKGYCYVTCHGKSHKPKEYAPKIGSGPSCSSCHSGGEGFIHEISSAYCNDCHWDNRPALPHPQSQDCAGCHTNPGGTWAAVAWDHRPTPSSCNECHESSRPSSPHPQDSDCSNCHTDPGEEWDD